MRRFEKIYEDAILPTRATTGSAGYDFHIYSKDTVYIMPGQMVVFETGIKAYMKPDEVLMLFIRSSAAIKRGLMLANNVAIIDYDYADNPENDGHIKIAIINMSKETQYLKPMERIAQGIFVKYYITDDDNAQNERMGGIGSTSTAGVYTELKEAA